MDIARHFREHADCIVDCSLNCANVRLMREDKALMESLTREFGTDLPEGGLTLTMRRDEPLPLPAPGSVVEIQNTSGEVLGHALVTQSDEEGFGGIASSPADDLPAGSS